MNNDTDFTDSPGEKMDELLGFILQREKRPGLYIGNTDLRCLGHFLSEYVFAKSEKRDEKFGKWLFDDFRVFLAEKYNDSRTYNWYGLIIANEVDGDSTDAFFRLLHEYLESRAEPGLMLP